MGFGLWLTSAPSDLGSIPSLRLEIEQKELNSKVDNHERLGSLIRG
jgi:hypothetical protein